MSDEPPASAVRGDMFAAAQMLAADNARLCGIVIAADELAAAVLECDARESPQTVRAMIAALDAYKVVRGGH